MSRSTTGLVDDLHKTAHQCQGVVESVNVSLSHGEEELSPEQQSNALWLVSEKLKEIRDLTSELWNTLPKQNSHQSLSCTCAIPNHENPTYPDQCESRLVVTVDRIWRVAEATTKTTQKALLEPCRAIAKRVDLGAGDNTEVALSLAKQANTIHTITHALIEADNIPLSDWALVDLIQDMACTVAWITEDMLAAAKHTKDVADKTVQELTREEKVAEILQAFQGLNGDELTKLTETVTHVINTK